MARHRIHFAPPSLRCPHCGGRAQGLFYHSTYATRDGPRRLWQCGECGNCLSERRGIAFFNLKTPELEVSRSVDAMLRGDTRTSTSQKSMAGESRLVIEQFVSPRTTEAAEMLVNRSFDRLVSGCLPRVSSDGYDAYTKPLSEQVRAVRVYPLWWALTGKGKPGRPPRPATIPDLALLYGQVVKEREGRQIVKVEERLVPGSPSTDLAFISTSLLERQNGTARSRNRYLVRKTYAFAEIVPYLDDRCEVDKTFYNFCRKHRGLKGETPAMRQGITDRVWSVAEVPGYRSAAP